MRGRTVVALDSHVAQVREKHRALLAEHHERFHHVWGQLLKTGYQNSRFAHQVERFACLYTSHVSNMCFYSPDKCYRWESSLGRHNCFPGFRVVSAFPAAASLQEHQAGNISLVDRVSSVLVDFSGKTGCLCMKAYAPTCKG